MQPDKMRHVIVAAVIGFAVFFITPPILFPAAFALLFAGGIGFEIYQDVTGTGVFEWGDIIADAIGLILAFAAAYYYRKKFKEYEDPYYQPR